MATAKLLYCHHFVSKAEAQEKARALRNQGYRPRIAQGARFHRGCARVDGWHVWELTRDEVPNK